MRSLASGAFALLLACSDSEWSLDDGGTLCLRSDGNSALEVQVLFPSCRSSSCDRVVRKGCSVARAGGTLRVASQITIDFPGGDCTADCVFDDAVCSVELEPGTFELVYGDQRASLTLPTTGTLSLFGEGSSLRSCD